MIRRIAPTLLAASLLPGCGSEEEPPVEQIVVREPGAQATPAEAASGASGDIVAAGKAAFAACAACHSVEAGAPSGIGPNLHAVVGREAGSLAGFGYSDAMEAANFAWDEARLTAFLGDPNGVVPGTSMVAGAVSDPERRAAIVAYLTTLSD